MRYLVATDGSTSSLKAARFLVERFRLDSNDEIFVIYVFPLPSDAECYDGIVNLPAAGSDPRVVEVAAPVLARTCEVLQATGSNLREVCLVGNPAKEIVEFAMNLDIEIIVAGIRGRSLVNELYLGSVSNALVHRAPCSVLVVR
jgi:nucleotide-binding universal stress UspA family protein